MGRLNTFYNIGTWGYMGVGPTPSKSFTLTVGAYVGYSWNVPFEWEKIGILFYKIGDTSKYAVHKTATLDVVGDNYIVYSDVLEQSVDITYNPEDWDFYGGFTASDLDGAAICFFTKEPAGVSGSGPNGLDYASITDTTHITFSYTLLPARFANKIDGSDIYAKRAECDSDGNPINTTYATKSELAGKQGVLTAGDNITIDSDGVISAAGGGGETYTAGEHIAIDSDGVISTTGLDNSNIFWCVRGLTTFAEARAAYSAGKHLFMTDGALIVPALSVSSTIINFVYCSNAGSSGGPKINRVSLDTTYGWGIWTGTFQADWNSTDTYSPSYIKNKPNLSDYQKNLTEGTGIDLDSDGNISVDSTIATKTYVDTAVQGKADSATTLAGYGITDAYTKTQVDNALNDKQGTLTGITDVQVVAALPGTPVATVLYLIPEA